MVYVVFQDFFFFFNLQLSIMFLKELESLEKELEIVGKDEGSFTL